MRKVVFHMMSTLNGRLDDPFAWVDSLSDDLYEEIDRVYDTFDTILVGRTTYEEMAAYWPGAESDAPGSEINNRMARKMNRYGKLVFSREGHELATTWNNARLVHVTGDEALVAFITDLKNQPGNDIHLSGGARFAQTVIRLGLVDAYHFYDHPVVSPGATWFDEVEDDRAMTLTSATAYENGVVGLYYQPKDTPATVTITHFSELLDQGRDRMIGEALT